MHPDYRATARRQLDKRLNLLKNIETFARPSRGWIKAIREALGMTTTQLAKRLGVAQSRAVAIEQAEAEKTLTLNTLEKAAYALDCRLVYALVPRKPLTELVMERAEQIAKQQLSATRHSMALEAQEVDTTDEQEQFKQLVERLREITGSKLWNDDE